MLGHLLVLVLLAAPQGVPDRSLHIASERMAATIHPAGVVTGLPRGARTVDGPQVVFGEEIVEWYGVRCERGGESVAVVGGALPDWDDRQLVHVVAHGAHGNRARTVARAGDLQIEHEFFFDELGPYLIVRMRLRNEGEAVLRQVHYTREWFVAGEPGWTFPDDLPAVGPGHAGVHRRVWMFDDLQPGAEAAALFSYAPAPRAPAAGSNVPLALWTAGSFPTGLVFGNTRGVSWGDFDGDGWVDVLAAQSGLLWRNLQGTDWALAVDLDANPPGLLMRGKRYGAAFADYDNNGKVDIAFEPRVCCTPSGPSCFQVLRDSLETFGFVQVATPEGQIIGSPCEIDSESICWGDVDFDGDLDLLLPAYPPWAGGGNPRGNFFWTNRGPTGPRGAYRFDLTTNASGLHNPENSPRPEGAQFCDIDGDGDLDLFCNGRIYQNDSTAGVPRFHAMMARASGITLNRSLDEGAIFCDYDMDGDYDLAMTYPGHGVVIWGNRGDGTFVRDDPVIDCPFVGMNLGISAEDWDNDGDLDLTTRHVFRRNQLVETGRRWFTVANQSFPLAHISSLTPAWADWDRDGDLDCAMANWGLQGHFYENDTYGPATPMEARRFVRVRPLADSAAVPAGLETEFGASVEIVLRGEGPPLRRIKLTSSSSGYLNQNEYALHFGLPADPTPADPSTDLHFDVVVEFPSDPRVGRCVVDGHVNPVLAGLDLAQLVSREIAVFRSGRVRIDGVDYPPAPFVTPTLTTSAGGLATARPRESLAPPVAVPGDDWYVGLAFDTVPAAGDVHVRELVIDGQLALPVAVPWGTGNIALWDVTVPGRPRLEQTLAAAPSPRNDRHSLRVDWQLAPGRSYRLVARVVALRETPFVGPRIDGPMTTWGGLSFGDREPGTGALVAAAATDRDRLYLAVRAR